MKSIHIQDRLGIDFSTIRKNLDVPESFEEAVLAEASEGFRNNFDRQDHTELRFLAIDPEGSTDLDQALHISETHSGFQVLYAIADVAEFLKPSFAIDHESWNRGVTLYSPDLRSGLYPPQISEDRASLLAGTSKPCVLWTIELDSSGNATSWRLERSQIEVSEAISYTEAQKRLDNQSDPMVMLLETVGKLRIEIEAERDAVSINLPNQEVVKQDKQFVLEFQYPRAVEKYNAQISLLTGMLAGITMGQIGRGVLRTLPSAPPEVESNLRKTAKGLGLSWDSDISYAAFVRSIQPSTAEEFAFLNQATAAFRGASYVSLANTDEPLESLTHSAIASQYAHVTAPLRRLVDRYNNEILLSHYAGVDIPDWAADLDHLPSLMNRAKQKSSALDRAVTNYVECIVLAAKVGTVFKARVIDNRKFKSTPVSVIEIDKWAIVHEMRGVEVPHGIEIQVELTSVDLNSQKLAFKIVEPNQ